MCILLCRATTCCSFNVLQKIQKKTVRASLFSRKQGLGIPMHIKMPIIWTYIGYHTLYIHIYIYRYIYIYIYINYVADPFPSPCYCPSIAYRLPLVPICSALMNMGRAHIHYGWTYRHQGQMIGNRYSKGNIIDM